MTLRLLGGLGARWSLASTGAEHWQATCWQALQRPLANLTVESDASAAAVACAASLIAGRTARIVGLPEDSLQGDSRFLELLRAAGAEVHPLGPSEWQVSGEIQRGFHLNLADTPDLAPPLVALGAAKALGRFGAKQPSYFEGLETLQGKESPRLSVLTTGLQRLGIAALHDGRSLTLPIGSYRLGPHVLAAELDHRMAFAFGLLALWLPGVSVADSDCVRKSWPDFWEQMARLRRF